MYSISNSLEGGVCQSTRLLVVSNKIWHGKCINEDSVCINKDSVNWQLNVSLNLACICFNILLL